MPTPIHGDATVVAAPTGARVVPLDGVFPTAATARKGEAMWRALAAHRAADLIVFARCADLRSFTATYDQSPDRAHRTNGAPGEGGVRTASGGGDSTAPAAVVGPELVARPLLNLYWPELAGVIQPLAGVSTPPGAVAGAAAFPVGYGVEFAMLVDTAELLGVDATPGRSLGVPASPRHDERNRGRMAAASFRRPRCAGSTRICTVRVSARARRWPSSTGRPRFRRDLARTGRRRKAAVV